MRPMQPPITAATSLTGGSTSGSSFVEAGFGSPPEPRSGAGESMAFGPEKMAFAAAAAAMAAANSNNAKGNTPVVSCYYHYYAIYFCSTVKAADLEYSLLFECSGTM